MRNIKDLMVQGAELSERAAQHLAEAVPTRFVFAVANDEFGRHLWISTKHDWEQHHCCSDHYNEIDADFLYASLDKADIQLAEAMESCFEAVNMTVDEAAEKLKKVPGFEHNEEFQKFLEQAW